MNNIFKRDNKVIMYASDTCGDCQAAKKFFAERQIDVEYKNIAEEKYRDELINKYGRRAVPTIVIGKNVILGFNDNKKEIMELLNLSDDYHR